MKLVLLVMCSIFIVPLVLCSCAGAPLDISSISMQTYESDTFSVVFPADWEISQKTAPGYFLAVLRTDTGNERASVEIRGGNNVVPGTDVEAGVKEAIQTMATYFNKA